MGNKTTTTLDDLIISDTLTNGYYNINIGKANSTYTTNGTYSVNNWSTSGPSTYISNKGIDIPEGADLKIGGKSLKDFMTSMEDRLAILQPDPKKLEKYEALRLAYEHYKLMEKLIGENE